MTNPVTIVHLYPQEMNIYGDRGNVIALSKRLEWRGIDYEVVCVGLGDSYDLARADLVFSGGGQDAGQIAVAVDLARRAKALRSAVDDGVPILAICGTYQLLGHRFLTAEGDNLEGIGIFDCDTVAGESRMIGNIVIDTDFGTLVGFENHGGRTRLGSAQPALGRVVSGAGNDGTSGKEGAVRQNAVGTYLHGPVLPKNPHFADYLLAAAVARHGLRLEPLDDSVELEAARTAQHLRP